MEVLYKESCQISLDNGETWLHSREYFCEGCGLLYWGYWDSGNRETCPNCGAQSSPPSVEEYYKKIWACDTTSFAMCWDSTQKSLEERNVAFFAIPERTPPWALELYTAKGYLGNSIK